MIQLIHGRVHDLLFGRDSGTEFLDDPPALGHENPVGQIHDLRQVGRDHQNGKPVVGQPVDELMDIGDRADIDSAAGLV
jgi:hypothetical protein